MPGRALEIALATGDIRRSFEFWTRLGFGSALTTDTWSHPYGVLTAPNLNIGLHETSLAGPLVTLARPDIIGLVPLLEERGVEPEALRLGTEVFNELQFTDPAGLRVRIVEARTFSPAATALPSLLGRFEACSWPAAEPDAVKTFWQRLHVEAEPVPGDWALLRADLGGQPLSWHAPRVANEPLLVFTHPDLRALREHLALADVAPAPRGLGFASPHVTLGSPEGQRIVVLPAD